MALGGCAKPSGAVLDAALPEDLPPLPDLAPEAVLVESASGLEPSSRARALGLLALLDTEPGGGEWGARALWDPSDWVQRAGVVALGARLGESESVALLEQYVARTNVDPYVRARAAMFLGRDSGVAREQMSAAWRAEDEPWRIAPLALAAATLGDADAVGPLADALASGEIGLEVDFVLDVGRSGLTDVLPALREGAENVEEELILPYAAAQLALGDDSGEQSLRKALGDSDEELRLEALDYVSRLDHEAATALLRKAKVSGPDMVRWYSDLALAARSGEDIEVLERAMAEPQAETRSLAVRFAAESYKQSLGSKRVSRVVRKVLRAALADTDAGVRQTALRAIADLRLDGEDELLHENLRHHEEEVRIEAAGALMARATVP